MDHSKSAIHKATIDYIKKNDLANKQNEIHDALYNLDRSYGTHTLVVPDVNHLPSDLQREISKNGLREKTKGVFDTLENKIYLVAENIDDQNDAVLTYMHELIGHEGVGYTLKARKAEVMGAIYNSYQDSEALNDINTRYKLDTAFIENQQILAEELVAHMAMEPKDKPSLLAKTITSAKEVWSAVSGREMNYKDSDIYVLLSRSKEAVRKFRVDKELNAATLKNRTPIDIDPQLNTLSRILPNATGFNAWLVDYMDGDYNEVVEAQSSPLTLLEYFRDYLSNEHSIDVNEQGHIELYEINDGVKKIVGDELIAINHYTSSTQLDAIQREGLRVTDNDINRHGVESSGVYVTLEHSGAAVEGYQSSATRKLGGDAISLTILTKIKDLQPDPDDQDISSGKFQFILPSVHPSQIVEAQASENRYRFLFGGDTASLEISNQQLFDAAVLMKAENCSAEDIRIETGWFQGADQQWRFEIDDSKCLSRDEALGRLADIESSIKTFNSRYKGEGDQEVLAKALRHLMRQRDNLKEQLSYPEGTLGHHLIHPELYKAYPELKDVKVSHIEGDNSYYDPTRNMIELGDYDKAVILHETQHAIQKIEGFAKGGTPEFMAAKDEVKRRIEEIENSAEYREAFLEYRQTLFDLQVESTKVDVSAVQKETFDKFIAVPAVKRLAGLRTILTNKDHPEDAYKVLFGEIEAMAVQDRAAMNAAERLSIAPYATRVNDLDNALVHFEDDIRNAMVAGVGAKQRNIESLDDALKLQREGVADRDIWASTGWFQGYDDKWRFEIDDSNASFKPKAFAELENALHQFGDFSIGRVVYRLNEERKYDLELIPSHANKVDDIISLRNVSHIELMKKLKPEVAHAIFSNEGVESFIDEEMLEAKQIATDFVYSMDNCTSLQNILEHDALFEAYPQLKSWNLAMHPKVGESWGMCDPEAKTIVLFPQPKSKMMSVLVHEIQHAVQMIEGFATGTSPSLEAERESASNLGTAMNMPVKGINDDGNYVIGGDQTEPAPTYYSQMEDVLNQKLPNKGTSQTYIESIKGLVRKGGFKQEELDYSGVIEWLEEQEGAVLKQDIAQFLEASRVNITPITLEQVGADKAESLNFEIVAVKNYGDLSSFESTYDFALPSGKDAAKLNRVYEDDEVGFKILRTDDGNHIVLDQYDGIIYLDDVGLLYENPVSFETANNIAGMALARENDFSSETNVKYEQYKSIKGGSDYKEVLLTLPDVENNNAMSFTEWYEAELCSRYGVASADKLPSYYQLILKKPSQAPMSDQRLYQSVTDNNYNNSHWEQSNVLSHIRFESFKNDLGQKVLLLHEVQSDWHQAGRRYGYEAPKKGAIQFTQPIELTAEQKALIKRPDPDNYPNSWEVPTLTASIQGGEPIAGTMRVWAENYEEAVTLAKDYVFKPPSSSRSVPDGPFKKVWPLTTIKWAMRYAAENGYDQVSWTTGEKAAETFDLGDHIESVSANWTNTQKIGLVIIDHDGDERAVISDPELLEDHVGLALATQIRNDLEPTPPPAGTVGDITKTYEGLDLKISDAGMKGFYDDMLPNIVNRYIKKWGSKSETINLANESRDQVHGFSISESMRLSIVQGQPMYSIDYKPVTPDLGFNSTLQELIATKLGKRAQSTQVVKMLNAAVAKGQLKSEELEFSGLVEYLEGHGGTVYKQELLDQLNILQIPLQLVELRGDDTQYSSYKATDVKNDDGYTELLLKYDRSAWNSRGLDELMGAIDTLNAFKPEEQIETNAEYMSALNRVNGLKARREVEDSPYESKHFEDKKIKGLHEDIIAHARYDIEEIDGGKKFILQELQSDVHQAGRTKGYREFALNNKERKLEKLMLDKFDQLASENEMWAAVEFETHPSKYNEGESCTTIKYSDENHLTEAFKGGQFNSVEHAKIMLITYTERTDEMRSLQLEINAEKEKMPDLPFKKSWSVAMFKQTLQKAIEEGCTEFTWSKGINQAELYSLRKIVGEVKYDCDEEALYVNDENYCQLYNGWGTPESFEEDLGKAFVEKLTSAVDEWQNEVNGYEVSWDADEEAFVISDCNGEIYYDGGGDIETFDDEQEANDYIKESLVGPVEFEGSDLALGGEGLQAFYDTMLPKIISKYIKKWDAKVEEVDGEWKFEITDQMKKSITLAGQPMYSTDIQQQPAMDRYIRSAGEVEARMVERTYLKPELRSVFPIDRMDVKKNDAIVRYTNGVAACFGGPNSATANLSLLAKAQQIAGPDYQDVEARKTMTDEQNRAIFDATGWFTGRDGQWRYEIDESRFSLREDVPSLRKNDLNELAAKHGTLPLDMIKALPAYSAICQKAYSLNRVIDAPELFEAYPALNIIKVAASREVDFGAEFNPQTGVITYSPDLDEEMIVDAVLCQVEHVVHQVEGYGNQTPMPITPIIDATAQPEPAMTPFMNRLKESLLDAVHPGSSAEGILKVVVDNTKSAPEVDVRHSKQLNLNP